MESNKYKKIFWVMLVLANAAAIGLIIFLGATRRDFSLNQQKNARLIGESYMTMNNEFYEIISEALNAQVEAKGDRVILRNPALSAERQIEQIEEMLEEDIDVLVITPVDWTSLSEVLKKAKAQGVYIVVVDTNVSDEELADCTITSDNYKAGSIAGEYFLSQCREAKLIIMTHEATKSGQERVQGFIDTISTRESIEIVRKIECEGQAEIAMPKLQEAIDEGVVFDNVFCLNDPTGVGVVAALDDNGILERVDVYGVDAYPDAKALIYADMMKATVAQFPTELGNMAAEVIYKLLDGEEVEKKIMMPVELVTKENVEEFGVDKWQ